MAKPLEQVTKEYPPRGPLRQFRFEKSLAFSCFRCGQNKTSKLITIYQGDWSKRLCNGCYGYLLSVFDIKSGTLDINEKVEQLSLILTKAVNDSAVREQTKKLLLMQEKNRCLSPASMKFYATSEYVANSLSNDPGLDWSPAIIGLCKAFELELIERIITPLKELCTTIQISKVDIKDKDYGRIANYCYGNAVKPPELGVVGHFIQTAISSKERFANSDFLNKGFNGYISKRPKSNWLIDKNCLVASINTLTSSYRNKAAHIDELNRKDYDNCKSFIFGENGIMWELITSTQPIK